MNQVFAGGVALIIALILWSSKKQLKGSAFFKSQKDSSVKMNRVALWEISFLILAQLLLLLKQVIDAASWLDFPPQQ